MRTAPVFRSLLAAGVVLASASVAWGGSACCASKSVVKAQPSCEAAPVATSTPSATETAGATAPAEAGMRVYLDPESGMVIGLPPVQDPAAIEPQAAAPILQEEVLPDGSVMVDLKGTGQEYYLIQLDADGKPVASCVQDPAKALAAPVAAPGVK